MFLKTAAVAAMTLGLATGAFAQAANGDSGSGGIGDSPMQMWDGEIGQAFFTDAAAGKLRPEAEAKERFSSLTMAQQDKVRSDCKAVDSQAAAGPMSEACGWVKSM